MLLIKSDKMRRIEIPGVPGPVQRPVDIDQAITGFTHLRTLRIYHFESGAVIEGHAEEDEVFIVLLSGSAALTMFEAASNNLPIPPLPVTLSAPEGKGGAACAAFLPPHAAYKLIANSDADVAYARATPIGTRPSKVFVPSLEGAIQGVSILLDVADYAERRRLRLLQIDTQQEDAAFVPFSEADSLCEALVHVRTIPATGGAVMSEPEAAPILLDSWDTVSVAPGACPTLQIRAGSSAWILLVLVACNS